MLTSPKLLRSCSISAGRIMVDGNCVFEGPEVEYDAFSNAAFKQLQLDYPKFHKMDNLSKLGFLAAEYVFKNRDFEIVDADKMGVVLANSNSSADTDLRYNAQLQQGVASPALFVYTLPNIVIGEICIRHGFKGENLLFVSEEYDMPSQVSYVSSLLESRVMDQCLGGWVDFFNQEYRAFFYMVGESPNLPLPYYTAENVATLFTA